jgi:hypothetical protein
MAKRNKPHKAHTTTPAAAPATTSTVSAPVTVTPEGKAKPQVILEVKAGVKYRGARAAWYERLCKFEGKPAADYLADTTANPPSLPKSGVQEKATGWLGFFTRTGIAKVG